jgi:ATPase involved in DNA replication initiation
MEAVTKIYNPEFLRRVRARRAEKERREREKAPKLFAIHRNMPAWAKQIIADCCRALGLTPEEAFRKNARRRHIVACRHEIFWTIRNAPQRPSYPRIASWFGLDHTTVIHAVSQHEKRVRKERAAA